MPKMYTFRELKDIATTNRKNRDRIIYCLKIYKLYPIFSVFLTILIFIGIIYCFVYLIAELSFYDLSNKNTIGDAFGGITNPIVASIGVFVTFLAFYIQYKFNKEQSKLIAQQRAERITDKKERDREIAREHFQRKFYELLKMHNDSVKEFNIANKYYGRKCFVKIYNELDIITSIVEFNYSNFKKKDNIEFDIYEISYRILFHGLSLTFDTEYSMNFNNDERFFLNEIKKNFESIQSNYEKRKEDVFYDKDRDEYEIKLMGSLGMKSYYIDYYPFDGHSHRLNHYFRHLLNFLQIIDKSETIDNNEKKEYIDIIRAQMSNYEQAILYYNIIAWFPKQWYVFVKDYTFLKNLTKELSVLSTIPQIYYRDEISELKLKRIKMFEWVKID